MVIEELIHENDKPIVMRALLLKHRHVNEHSHGGFHFGSRRKFSSYTSLQVMDFVLIVFLKSFINDWSGFKSIMGWEKQQISYTNFIQIISLDINIILYTLIIHLEFGIHI